MNRLRIIAALGALSVVLGSASASAAETGQCAGTWKIEFETPMGPQTTEMKLTQKGEELTGKAKDPMGETDVTGSCKGDVLSISQKIQAPFGELKLEFVGKVSGKTVAGDVVMGDFGSTKFTGKKE